MVCWSEVEPFGFGPGVPGKPGGPAVERAAGSGDPARFPLPRPMQGRPGCDFSFSGLKNAVRLTIAEIGAPSEQDRNDIAASFQMAVADALADRTRHGIKEFSRRHPGSAHLVVAGGVAANAQLRQTLAVVAADAGFVLIAPPLALCTDNAAMIAWAGLERFRLGLTDGMDFAPRPRWPLDPQARHLRGAGVKA